MKEAKEWWAWLGSRECVCGSLRDSLSPLP